MCKAHGLEYNSEACRRVRGDKGSGSMKEPSLGVLPCKPGTGEVEFRVTGG